MQPVPGAGSSGSGHRIALDLGDGAALRVDGLGSRQLAQLQRAWSRFRELPTDAQWHEPVLSCPTTQDETSSLLWSAFHEELSQLAARLVIDAGRGTSLMLHAAAVSDRSGRALVLAAPSGTGKTTATATLGRSFGYLSDETSVIEPSTLSISPFPKPLSVLRPHGRRPKDQVGPDELGLLEPVPSRLHLLGVLLRRRERDDSAPRLRRMPLLEALEHLVPQTSSLSQMDRGLVLLIRTLERLGGAWALEYSEQHELLGLAERLLGSEEAVGESPEPAQAPWEPVPREQLRQEDAAPTGPGMLRSVPVDDAVMLTDPLSPTLLLLRDEHFHCLVGLGPQLWFDCLDWRSRDELVAELLGLPGAPQDAEMLVHRAIEDLLELGALESSGDPQLSS